jgi:MFS family permease
MNAPKHSAHSSADDGSPAGVNAQRLLWAGFMAILAAGVGFAIRGGILDNWGAEFGLTAGQIGDISGQGLTGFCFGIIIGGVIADRIGYGKLVITAFVLHVLSAVMTFLVTKENAFSMLYWSCFVFALANGTLEAVANPLVATLFPRNRAHYLNILHASWPAGLVLGTVMGWVLDDKMKIDWKIQLALYLVPTIIYGLMFLGQKMPKSEASETGASLGEMFKDVGILGGLVICYLLALFFAGNLGLTPAIAYGLAGLLLLAIGVITKFSIGSVLLFVLFVTHALVGAVELGTDNWIQNITGNLFSSEQGKWLFIWTSAIMFGLRFCTDFIEKRLGLSPINLLLVCSVLACVGLLLSANISSLVIAFVALGVYAVGKTFFWPTMLAVASDQFPRSGAVAISIMGGVGMLSAGLIGGPGLGYCKDRFAGESLQTTNKAVYETYKAAKPSTFLGIPSTAAIGLDGVKLGDINKKLEKLRGEVVEKGGAAADALQKLPADERAVYEASIAGDRRTLRIDAFIPGIMAAIYLLLSIYFSSRGGYRRQTIA